MRVRVKKLAAIMLAGTLAFSGLVQPGIVYAEEMSEQEENISNQEVGSPNIAVEGTTGETEITAEQEAEQGEKTPAEGETGLPDTSEESEDPEAPAEETVQGEDPEAEEAGIPDEETDPAIPGGTSLLMVGEPFTEDVAVVLTQGDQEIGRYASVGEALTHVADYNYKTNKIEYVITVQKNLSEDIVIPANKKIAIDLNGCTITNVNDHTIYNNSLNIRVIDGKGGGVVDNITHGKAAVYNNIKANIKLQGGSFTRSQEASTGDSSSGGNSFYVLKNFGTMTIYDGVTVKFSELNPGLYSSLIGNGWQDAAAAEAGTNGEPKPSEATRKEALLDIRGGNFTGGQITVKNDDYGNLTISGGTIVQPSDGRAAVANNHKAKIKGGVIEAQGKNGQAVYSRYFDTNGANKGELEITGGSFKSAGTVIQAQAGSKLTVTGGEFTANESDNYIFDVQDNVTSSIKNGTYVGVAADKVANRKDAFAEGYGPVEGPDGKLTVDVTEEGLAAVVTDREGKVTKYTSLGEALGNAQAGSTVTLKKDIVLTKGVSTSNQPGITFDLNGYNIDGTSVKTDKGVVNMTVNYGWRPVEGVDSTMRVINSQKPAGGEIKGTLPLRFNSGDSSYDIAGEIGEGVKLVTLDKDASAVKLGTSAYLVYSDSTKGYIKNGGFKATAADGTAYIYGSYSSATDKTADGVITMLNDYMGTDKIYSGSRSAVLDLGGHTYTYTGKDNVLIDVNYPDVSLTIKKGKIIIQNESCDGAHLVGAPNQGQMNNRTLILEEVELTVPGEVYGIATNGTETGNKIVLKNSTLNVTNGYGIYFPSTGSVTIDNSVINAKYAGVQMCAGDLTVTGADTKITVTGTPQEKQSGDGAIADGAAISVIERDGYKDLGNVTIEAGTFRSDKAEAIRAYKFDITNKDQEWPEAGTVVNVNGGNFSSVVPQNICGDQFVATEIDPSTGLATVIKDVTAPVLLVNGKAMTEGIYYGGKVQFTVKEDYLAEVTVNGNKTEAENGLYTVSGAGRYIIAAADIVGNKTEVKITIQANKGLISADTAKVNLVNTLVENGAEQTQEITVTVEGVTLAEGVDYKVEGNKAVKAGTYTLKVTGIGNYEGSIDAKYTVEKKPAEVGPSEPQKPGSGDSGNSGSGSHNSSGSSSGSKNQNINSLTSAKTGDETEITFYVSLSCMAFAVFAALAAYRKYRAR